MNRTSFPSPLGLCSVAWDDRLLHGFELPEPRAKKEKGSASLPAWVEHLIARVQKHLGGHLQDFADLPYDFSRVTPFQKQVYLAALAVPAGEIRTYGWLAVQTGRTSAASRAIGRALGANPWPLLVPCHRFVGANGKLTGYSAAGGLETKRRLLRLEESAASLLSIAAAI